MRFPRKPTAGKRLGSLLGIVAVLAINGALALCQCRIAVAFDVSDAIPSPSAPACCSHSCDAGETDRAACCTPDSTKHEDCPGCVCSSPPTLTLQPSELRLDHLSSSLPNALAVLPIPTPALLSCELIAGVDHFLPGKSPGVRLHALLCVWRN